MKLKSLKDIFVAFFRAGMLGYGGGLSAIPLMHREVVQTYNWMDEDEFSDVLALANTLPGPINTKLSGYIGWRLAGLKGLIVALIATVIPTVILMILLLTTLNAFKDNPWVQGMAKGVIPIAAVMIGSLTWNFIKSSKNTLGWKGTVILIGISLLVMEVFGLHPAILILSLIVIALASREKQVGYGKKKEKKEIGG